MKSSMFKQVVFGLVTLSLVAAPLAGFAQENKPKAEKADKAAPAGEKRQGAIPFNGKISAVDTAAKTITVGSRKFQLDADTKIMKAGKPATLADAQVGEQIGGNYIQADDGTLKAKSVRFGPKPEKAEKPAKEKKTE